MKLAEAARTGRAIAGTIILFFIVALAWAWFGHEGQAVEVKIETFTFTRYGLIHGRVVGVSRDTVTDDQRKPDRPGKGDSDNSGSPSYVARVALERTSLSVDGEERTLGPGMAVSAEIKTGSRRILSYLLSPLRQYAQDAGRER